MKTAGLDIATCTGMALVGDEEDRGKTVHIPKERGILRLQLIANDVGQTLNVWHPKFVVVEGYAYVRNVGAFVTLVEVGTIIRMALRQLELPWVEVPPSTLKKWVTKSGNANKEQMAQAALERWRYRSHSHDIIDALCLAQMGQLGWDGILNIPGVSVGWKA